MSFDPDQCFHFRFSFNNGRGVVTHGSSFSGSGARVAKSKPYALLLKTIPSPDQLYTVPGH